MLNIDGKWQGRNHLWLYPGDPVRESDTTAEIRTIANGHFTEMHYHWADDGKPQDGLMVLGQPNEDGDVEAFWLDSWHMQGSFMHCRGGVDSDGTVSVKGSYPAPPGPDWGWELSVGPEVDGTFLFRMYNITPEGEKALAVEVNYSRA